MKTESVNRLAISIFAICVSLLASDSVDAFTGGSWGSRGVGVSRGSWGSSRGSNGGFRTPVRNFFASLPGRRVWGSGGSVGGSVGVYGSVGSRVSWGSSGGFASSGVYGSVGGSTGSVGTRYISTVPSYQYPTMTNAYPINSGTVTNCNNCGGGIPINAGVGVPMLSPAGELLLPSDARIVQPGSIVPGGQYYEPPTEGSTPAVPPQGNEAKDQYEPPTPQPEGETTSIRNPKQDEAVLNLSLPLDAKVYINGKLTKTTGRLRSFVSRRLKVGGKYSFEIKAVASRNGQDVVLERKVELLAGKDRHVSLDFDAPQMTQLSVRVPSDAKVTLAGNETKATGNLRHYKSKLKPGEQWNDYKVVVTIEKDGRTVQSEKKLDIVAGQSYVLDFRSENFDEMFASK